MKSKYPVTKGCIPSPGGALAEGVLPEYFQKHDISVTLDSGVKVKSCHLISDGRRFNFKKIYEVNSDWQYCYITQFSYLNPSGEIAFIDVAPRNPHVILKDNVTTFGYTTKINGLRWGVIVRLNWNNGDMQIIADRGSPIVGTLIQFI